jgi:hypothetical protein
VRRLVLIDPDIVESHNLDAMDGVTARAIGSSKVEALAGFLRRDFPEIDVIPVQNGVETPAALTRAAEAEVIISAPDAGRPRFFAAVAAVLFCRPHLDVGTGIFRRGGTLEAGADIRLIVPGEGCLNCVGGIRRLLSLRPRADWRSECARSLRSLNQIAAHAGLYLVERLFSGDRMGTTWQRIEARNGGPLSLTALPNPERRACRVCALLGRGEGIGLTSAGRQAADMR